MIKHCYIHIILLLLQFGLFLPLKGQAPSDSLALTLKQMPSDTQKVELLIDLVMKNWENNPAQSMAYVNEAILISQELGAHKKLGTAYNLKAGIYRIYGNLPKCLKALRNAEKYYKLAKAETLLSDVYSNLGAIYYDIHEDSISMLYTNKAIEAKKVLGDNVGIGLSLTGKAVLLQRIGRFEEAFQVYEEALKILNTQKDIRAIAVLHENIGNSYLKTHQLDKALFHCQESRKYSIQEDLVRQQFYSELCICNAYLAQNNTDSLVFYLTLTQHKANLLDDLDTRLKISEIKSKYFEVINQLDSALYYEKVSRQITDSLYLQEKEKERAQLEIIESLNQKDKEAEQLILKQEQQQAIIRLLYLFGGLALIALFFISILWIRQARINRKLMKAYKLVSRQRTEIDQQRKRLKALNNTKSQLFSIISHDLMAPVNALASILQLQKEKVLQGDKLEQFIENAMMQVTSTNDFLRNLLFWAKNQMDGIKVDKKNIPLNPIIHNNVDLLKSIAEKKNIHLKVELEEQQEVLADADLIDTILRNLISNAIKFTPKHGQILVKSHLSNDKITLSVIDNGVGMSAEAIEQVLGDSIYSTYGTSNEKGTGLGLKLCQEFIALNDSQLLIESQEGKGSQFSFELPCS